MHNYKIVNYININNTNLEYVFKNATTYYEKLSVFSWFKDFMSYKSKV